MSGPISLSERLEVFSTCPQSKDLDPESYMRHVVEVARWSDDAECTGILVYADNSIVDPWLVAQVILQNTRRLCPLVAVQPVYMHPYTAAKMVTSYAFLHGRRVYLNMVAGGFANDLHHLNDGVAHDDRYARLTEYTLVMKRLLEGSEPVTFEGKYYVVRNLRMTPALPAELFPGITMAGSSPAAMTAVEATGATGIIYPRPLLEEELHGPAGRSPRGVRIGIIARADEAEAWTLALERFPADRKGQLAHKLAMTLSDSEWHRQLSKSAGMAGRADSPYWLWPFENYKTFCPYLVGSYERIAREVARYIGKGCRTFILDTPRARDDLESAAVVFRAALERVRERDVSRDHA